MAPDRESLEQEVDLSGSNKSRGSGKSPKGSLSPTGSLTGQGRGTQRRLPTTQTNLRQFKASLPLEVP